jgi:hypothetical protein
MKKKISWPREELDDEGKRRLQSILRGAFKGPPTPLKDIPKKSGESRPAKSSSAK